MSRYFAACHLARLSLTFLIFSVIPLVLWQLISVNVRQVFGCDVFAHAKQIGGFSAGTEVSFAILLNKDSKPQAFDIEELSPSPASMGKGKGAMMVEHSGEYIALSFCNSPL